MICGMETTALHDRMKTIVGKTTFRALGQATNHNPETVRRYMSGQAPSVDFLSALVGAYAVNADWLLTGRGPMDSAAVRTDALSKADPNELMAAIANRMEDMCDRIDRIEVFVQMMETRLRAATPAMTEGHETEPNIIAELKIAPDAAGQKGRATNDHHQDQTQRADDPAASRAQRIADAIPGRSHPDTD